MLHQRSPQGSWFKTPLRTTPSSPFSFPSARSPSVLSKRRLISTYAPILVLSIFIFFPISSRIPIYHASSSHALPIPQSSYYTPLSATLPHVTRPQKPIENDWTTPSVLTALATSNYERTPQNDDVNLILFTTGIRTKYSARRLEILGCVIGNAFFNLTRRLGHTVVLCRIPKTALLPPSKDPFSLLTRPRISVAVRDDSGLRRNLDRTIQDGSETFFPIRPYLVSLPNPKNFSIPPSFVVKSSLTFHPSMLYASWSESTSQTNRERISVSEAPHELCLMTAMRLYPYLLEPFLAYYRQLGVDRFFLYDNLCEYDLKIFEGPDVEVVYWPWARSQIQSFTHFLHAARGRCKWVAFFDADEFAFVGANNNKSPRVGLLKQYVNLRGKQGYGQVVLPFISMRNNGHLRIPEGPIPEIYTMRSTAHGVVGIGKSIVSMTCFWGEHKVHYAVEWNRIDSKPGSGCEKYSNITMDLNPRALTDNAQLVHYTRRSWEEYRLKHRYGTSSAANTHRPKKILGKSPPKWYMEGGKRYTTFRDYWRMIMKESISAP